MNNSLLGRRNVALSIIIPAYNEQELLPICVDSVLAATQDISCEILIVDDGSSDQTLNIASDLAKHNSKLLIMTHPNYLNRGVAASRNLGIYAARGEYISFIDADDIMLPNRFGKAMNILINNNQIDGVLDTVGLYFESEKAKNAWGNAPLLYAINKNIKPDEYLEATLLSRTCRVQTASLLVRKSLFEKAGLYSEGMKLSEDYHLWLRMAACGRFAVGETDRPVAFYRRHEDNTWNPGIDLHGSIRDFYVVDDVLKWAKNSPYVSEKNIRVLKRAFQNKFRFCVDLLRKEQNRRELIKLFFLAAKVDPQKILTKYFLANFAYAVFGR
jgi:glycosyltransferase involved in cell wall biosynthesis